MGRTFLPSISLALTCYSDSRARNVSFKRISSDQFRRLQTGSMDVSRDREHDRTHLRDLLTSSARSVVSTVRGVGKRGSFPTSQIPKRGFGHVISLQVRDTPFKKLRKPASSISKHTQTLCPAAPGLRGMQGAPPKFRAATGILTRAFDVEKVRPTFPKWCSTLSEF